jgi:hypothetical protein
MFISNHKLATADRNDCVDRRAASAISLRKYFPADVQCATRFVAGFKIHEPSMIRKIPISVTSTLPLSDELSLECGSVVVRGLTRERLCGTTRNEKNANRERLHI